MTAPESWRSRVVVEYVVLLDVLIMVGITIRMQVGERELDVASLAATCQVGHELRAAGTFVDTILSQIRLSSTLSSWATSLVHHELHTSHNDRLFIN